jgi:hypothetical protein
VREIGKIDRERVMDSLEKDVRSTLLQKMGISAADIDFVLKSSSSSGDAKSSQFRIFTRDDRVKSYINIFRNGKNPHYTENIYSCGLNVLLDRSGHSTVEIIYFFIMSGLKYHNLYMCIKAQT